jgi:hypothetical protein
MKYKQIIITIITIMIMRDSPIFVPRLYISFALKQQAADFKMAT